MISAVLCLPACVPADLSKCRARLYAVEAIEQETYNEAGGSQLHITIPQVELLKILGSEGIAAETLEWSGIAPILSTTEKWEV
jgi:hypothetical protein